MSRLWVDANIVLRFITKEPENMAERAARLMAQAEAGEVSLYIAPLVLAEIVWVLRFFYWCCDVLRLMNRFMCS
jgi:predicted nucleic acid-binding protein